MKFKDGSALGFIPFPGQRRSACAAEGAPDAKRGCVDIAFFAWEPDLIGLEACQGRPRSAIMLEATRAMAGENLE